MSLALVAPAAEPFERAGDPRAEIRLGALIAFLFFVVLLGWAALAPLDAGVHAQGVIAVSGNRQSVQHRDGGVVTAIRVREGDHVKQGQVLVEMAAPDVLAAERAQTSDYLTLLAQRARLLAERSGSRTFAPPPEFAGLSPADRLIADQAMQLQHAQMNARTGAQSAQQSVLGQRSLQLREQQSGFGEQRSAVVEQERLMGEEIAGLKILEQKGFASTNRLRELQRQQAALAGQEAQMAAEFARTGQGMGETRMQSLSLGRNTMEEIATDLRDTQSKLSDVLPKLVATREQLQHATVRAPTSGQVLGLTVFTVGGVVAPGQTLMDIVPDGKMLVIQARIKPNDADNVYQGQEAQLRFVSVHDRSLPLLKGRVRTISADSFTDEKQNSSLFRAEIVVPPAELARVQSVLGRGKLRPGLPVEVILATQKRTALQYLLGPLIGTFWRSLHEQ